MGVCASKRPSSQKASESADVKLSGSPAVALRIVHITDVYTLENFPSLRTLIMEKRNEFTSKYGANAKTVSMLTGDFLMPYLLSTIDKGRGMMTMLNETPIDYLTWGNHESDMKHSDVCAREKEYNGVWVNSNMQGHESFEGSTCQTDAAWLELHGNDSSGHSRKVAMIGVMANSSSKPGAFGGATTRGSAWPSSSRGSRRRAPTSSSRSATCTSRRTRERRGSLTFRSSSRVMITTSLIRW